MKDYILLQRFIVGFLIFYFVAGLSTEVVLKGRVKNFPPFFSWFLFDIVPREHNRGDYAVRIWSVGDMQLYPPVYYDRAQGLVAQPSSAKARELIRGIGADLQLGKYRDGESLRKFFEESYLPKKTHYEVVSIYYDTLERFKTGQFQSVTVVGSYTKP